MTKQVTIINCNMNDKQEKIELMPMCLVGKDHYVNSDGNWLPCCFLPSMGPRYENLPFSDKRFHMANRTDEQCFYSPVFQRWIHEQMSDPKNAHPTCRRMCSKKGYDAKRKEQDVNSYNITKDTVFLKDLDL
jgi:hypothetical protein